MPALAPSFLILSPLHLSSTPTRLRCCPSLPHFTSLRSAQPPVPPPHLSPFFLLPLRTHLYTLSYVEFSKQERTWCDHHLKPGLSHLRRSLSRSSCRRRSSPPLSDSRRLSLSRSRSRSSSYLLDEPRSRSSLLELLSRSDSRLDEPSRSSRRDEEYRSSSLR